MKKVLLIGDEICTSYAERVKELLSDVCEILLLPTDAGYTANVFWGVRELIELEYKAFDADLIHWNTGLLDHHRTLDDGLPLVSAEEYLYWNQRLHRQLALYAPRLIWATTTPAGDGYRYDPSTVYGIPRDEWNKEVTLYNDMLAAYLTDKGVAINDLHALIAEHPEYVAEDGIHLSAEGTEATAQKVSREIRAHLETEASETALQTQLKKGLKNEERRFNW